MHSNRALRILLLSSVSLSLPALTRAQDAGSFSLDEIVVSGGLTGIAASDFTRAYSLVTAQDIAARGVTTVQDALRGLPGVSVVSTGDSSGAVYIRGGESNYTKVLIDGVEVNDPTSGGYTFAGLPVADIASIEVLRGPQSVLYGTSAMSGVISITTKKAEKQGLSYGGAMELAQSGQYDASAYLRQGFERGQIAFTTQSRRSNYDYGGAASGGAVPNRVDSATLSGDYALGNGVRVGGSLTRYQQDYDYYGNDSAATRPEDYLVDQGDSATRDQTLGALWVEAEAMGGRLLNRFDLSGMNENTDYHSPTWGDSYSDTTRRTFKYVGSFALDGTDARTADQKLNLLLSAERETFVSDYADEARNSRSVALDYQGRFAGGLDVQAGVRHDWLDTFADPTTWNLSAAWRAPGSAWRLRGSVGRGVINPTMIEQFGYDPAYFSGNPDLKPESSLNYEIGADLDLAGGRGTVGATLFKSDVKDLIDTTYVFDGTSWLSSVDNLDGTSTRKGVELSGTWQANDWLSLKASYTYTDASGPDGQRLTRRPQNELGLQATAQAFGGRGAVTADLRYVAGNYDTQYFGADYGSVKRLPEFATVNLSARYALNDTVEVTGRVVNLFDTDYSEAWGYYGQGRTVYVGLSTKW